MAELPSVRPSRRRRAVQRIAANPLLALLAAAIIAAAAFLLAREILQRAEGGEPPRPTARTPAEPAGETKPAGKEDPYAWKSLFDGKTLGQWKSPQFGGEGAVTVEDGAIVMAMGDSMTGVTWTGSLPRIDYELTLEGKRTRGNDFFCTTTFPVDKSPCSLVVGGWGGTVVGLSSVDYYDASDNETTKFVDFKDNQWYAVRIRVSKSRIEAWIDKEKLVDLETRGRKFSIRSEVDLCQPLGVSTWCSEGAVRNIRLRQLRPEEVKAIAEGKTAP